MSITVEEANRKYYEKTASTYDLTECCTASKYQQQMMKKDLDKVLNLINKPLNQIRVLDACGGTGNAALKLLAHGVKVTLCDISPDLIKIFEQKCVKNNFNNYTVVCTDIASYFASTDQKFDLIVFSSCLHHIENYVSILKTASGHLLENGFIYTTFDPLPDTRKFPTGLLRNVDWWLFMMFYHPKKLINRKVCDVQLINRAEFHAETGINDLLLISSLSEHLLLIYHNRFIVTRTSFIRWCLKILKKRTTFSLVFKKH